MIGWLVNLPRASFSPDEDGHRIVQWGYAVVTGERYRFSTQLYLLNSPFQLRLLLRTPQHDQGGNAKEHF